jgi:transcriptional antiterminator Rof (Rho-off)
LILGSNPIGSEGLEILAPSLRINDTLTLLDISQCGYRTKSLTCLQEALRENSTILRMDTSRNKITNDGQEMIQAEVEASNCLLRLTRDVHSVNAQELPLVVQSALQRKLRFLPTGVLQLLHTNPSFNEPFSDMMDELHMLCPPNRHFLINKVQETSETIKLRLAMSAFSDRRISAQRVIYNAVRK